MSTMPVQTRLRIAVLASGRGSNLQALIDAQRNDRLPIEVVLVASDKAHATALRRAEDAGIATLALDPKSYADRAAFDADLFARVAACEPDLIVLAGFMRILSLDVLAPKPTISTRTPFCCTTSTSRLKSPSPVMRTTISNFSDIM